MKVLIKHDDLLIRAMPRLREIPALLEVGNYTGQVDKFLANIIVPTPSAWMTVLRSNVTPVGMSGHHFHDEVTLTVMLFVENMAIWEIPLSGGALELIRLIRGKLAGHELGYDHQIEGITPGPAGLYLSTETTAIYQIDFSTAFDTSFGA